MHQVDFLVCDLADDLVDFLDTDLNTEVHLLVHGFVFFRIVLENPGPQRTVKVHVRDMDN
jgi:hypothetical protein